MELGHSSLTDLIFSWGFNDILNRDLYLHKVVKIPQTFSSVEHYLNSFINPVIEETHADLFSAMKALYQAPTCEILSVIEPKGYRPINTYEITFEIDMETSNKKEPYRPQSGDVILLSNKRPAQVNYFKRSPRAFVLAMVIKGTTDRIKTSKPLNEQYRRRPVYAVYLMNATTNIRIWEALKQETNRRNLNIIKEVLDANSTIGINCDHCSAQQIVEDIDLHPFNLNDSQTDAVLSSIMTSRCDHKNTIKLIWGPPGTGKTKTVATMLWAFLKLKCRTLTCAPTNTAVVEVTSRLLKLLKESLGRERYGFGDIVLFGNAGRMKIEDNDDLCDVFIDCRVKELENSFSEWKPCLDSMISFLKDPGPKYLEYLKSREKREERNEDDCVQNQEDSCKEEETENSVLTIGEFFRNKFNFIEEGLKCCIRSLLTNLPTSVLPVVVAERMKKANVLLDHIGTLLTSDNVTNMELREISIPFDDIGSTTLSDSLCESRVDCLEILTSLLNALSFPDIGDVNLLKEFCLQNACLIFCTASSSSILQTEEMKPFRMLVIDEAAQLKECESVVPLLLPGIQHAIHVGDECQLPAMVKSKICADADFGRSMFERMVLLGQRKHLLNVQYRMHPSISLFPNTEFYGNQIFDASNVQGSLYRKHLLQGEMYGPYSFINVAHGEEILVNGHSPRNPVESAVVSQVVAKLYEASVTTNQKISVGVISPYNGQVFGIQKILGDKYDKHKNFSLSVRSVDGFQGGEEDVIIISTVRSNDTGNVGFLDKHQRTNVALTRARHCLWIVGNERTLIDSNTVWTKLVRNAKERGHFFNADDDDKLVEGIVDAMVEIKQLDKLLIANSLLFRGARWKVVFGDGFLNSLERTKEVETQKKVVSLLKKLSSGWRDPSQTDKHLNIINVTYSELLNTINGGMLNLLWSVDILEENSRYLQVLKFWDILPLIEIPRLAKRLNVLFRNYTNDKIYRCNFKSLEGELEVPMSWEISPDAISLTEIQEIEHLHLSTHMASLNLEEDPES